MIVPSALTQNKLQGHPLRQQLALLRSRNPGKTHYRFALVNGFGGNLGDALVGITAFRAVADVLGSELPSFSIDILHGWTTNPATRDLFAHERYIQNVFTSGLTLTEFSHYDAHFDISALITYQRYDDLPAVDWYLWWLGLEPDNIEAARKRNQITFPYSCWQDIEGLLRDVKGRRIFFAHKASVSLRTIPEKQARRIATEMLSDDEKMTLILDSDIGINHPRILNLAGKIDSPDKLKALIAQVDGLVSIDSFPQHVADATATPTVLLSVVLPLDRYKYYPHTKGLLIPGAEKLSAWKKVKTTEEEWKGIEPAYTKLWSKLKGGVICTALSEKIDLRQPTLSESPAQFNFAEVAPRARFTRLHRTAGNFQSLQWKYETASPAWIKATEVVTYIGKTLLRPGCCVIHIGPGGSDAPVKVAEHIYPKGTYHIWEPRRLYAQTQAANFMLAGLDSLHLYQALPVAFEYKEFPLNEIDPFGETASIRIGNARHKTSCKTYPLDDFRFSMCRLLIIQPPMPYADVLRGANRIIKETCPIIMMGPIPKSEAGDACLPLLNHEYTVWADDVGKNHKEEDCIVIIAIGNKTTVQLEGYMKVEIANPKAGQPKQEEAVV